MFIVRSILILFIVFSATACNRHSAYNNNGGVAPVTQTDPNRFDPKPVDTTPVVQLETEDTVAVVEPPKPLPTDDDFAVAEEWMTPTEGSYLVAKIKRTGCYGTCPIYVGAIYSDGKAFYFGERFVENIGYFSGQISMEQLDALIKLSYQNHFYDLAPEYPTDGRFISDLPTKKLYINSGLNKKTVLDRGNAPEELDVIEEALQTLLHSIDWKPIKN